MPEPSLAQRLAEFAVAVRSNGAPTDVRQSAASRVLDLLGISIAASELATSAAVIDFVEDQAGGDACGIIGTPTRTSAAWAAFANGVLAHSLDFDDTHLPSVLHPSACVIPAALAVGESEGASGAEVLEAIAVGIETTVRIGMAGYDMEAGNSTFFEHGQHATSICGTIGAAIASAMLRRLDVADTTSAVAIACSMGSGILEGNRMGGTVKRIHCGWAAHAGVVASDLAQLGITGPPTALEGRFGLFEAFLHGRRDETAVTAGLGTDWSVPGVFFKPYPANHFTHAAADAVMALRGEGLRPADVARIRVGVPAPTVRTIGQPIGKKRRPANGYQAQFSGPYVVAAALMGGSGLGLGLDDFRDDVVDDPRRLTLMDKVDIEPDDRCNEVYPHQFPAFVDVTTTSGTHLSSAVLANRGGPLNPLSTEELLVKFTSTAGRRIDDAAIEAVIRRCEDLVDLAEVGSLIRLTQNGSGQGSPPAARPEGARS